MNAEALAKLYGLAPHVENGYYKEVHYTNRESERAASGSIFYYVAPEERTEFHVIDCDEYWIYTEGTPLEVWMADRNGVLTVRNLGAGENCEPVIYVPKGTVFASRHGAQVKEGTFLVCITVPRFDPMGFQMFTREEILQQYPQLNSFWE